MARGLAAALVGLGLVVGGGATAQLKNSPSDAAKPPAPPAEVTPPRIEISLVDAEDAVTVWGHLRVQIAFVGPPTGDGVAVRNVCVSLPGRLAMIVRKEGKDVDPCKILADPDPLELRGPGARSVAEVEFERRSPDWSLLPILPYQARMELLKVRADYVKLEDADETLVVPVESQLRVKVGAHPLGVFAGALLGSLLTAALAVSVRRMRTNLSDSFSVYDVIRLVVAIAGRFVRGGVAAAIVILLMKTTAELRMPISVDVHDFYGGVVLGLFGDAIALAIWRRIEAAENESAAAGSGQPGPTVPLGAAPKKPVTP